MLDATTCAADDCTKPRQHQRRYCHMHRGRMARNSSLDGRTPPPERIVNGAGYVMVYAPKHPLAGNTCRVPEHRMVLFASIGPGVHPCHWCGTEIEWGASGPRVLTGDHVDRDKLNNAPANIVAACNACNARRADRPISRRTHCQRGHAMSPDNIAKGTKAKCRECQHRNNKAAGLRFRARQRATVYAEPLTDENITEETGT